MISPIHPRALFRDLYPGQSSRVETGSLVVSPRLTGPENLPVIVIHVKYQSAACSLPTSRRGRRLLLPCVGHLFQSAAVSSSRAAGGKLLPRMMRSPLRALLGSLSRRYSRDLSRRVWNSFGPFEAARSLFVRASIQAAKQAMRVFAVLKCPGPFVGALFHARNKSMEMNAWRTEKPSIRSVK